MTAPARAGAIYVHFPYCRHRCSYCDFNLTTPKVIPQQRYTDAVLAELDARAADLAGPSRSLYVGGGTPSLWEPAQLARVVTAARRRPGLIEGAEVTVEANPNDVDAAWVDAMLTGGVNRISLGVQSLRDGLLPGITRRHSAGQALDALSLLERAPLRSYSVDLMSGLPNQSLTSWREDLARIAERQPPHLSIYELTVEPRTRLAVQVRDGVTRLPPEAARIAMFDATHDVLVASGYEHYEVSAYALPGHRAVHNSSYWDGTPYLGLGAGAHGFAGGRRWVDEPNPKRYIDAALATGLPTATEETPDADTAGFERVMTGLRRLVDGVDLGADWPRYERAVTEQVALGLLDQRGAWIRLTRQGMRVMDDVLLALLPEG